MEGKRLTMLDLLVETHIGLERQGPGSPEATTRALSFVENPGAIRRTADLGCGTGGQTMMLAQHLGGTLVGLDQFPTFIDRFNANAEKQQLQNRVTGLVGSMEDLPFAEGSLDLVWSEGAIDNIGFEKGLTYWNAFLKKDGYVAVTCPSWFTDERPAEVEKLWSEAGSRLDAIADNIAAMQRAGYVPAAAFVLPEVCWTEHYFRPRAAAGQALREKYPGDSTVEEFLEMNRYEEALYDRYKALYGYVFYIGKKR